MMNEQSDSQYMFMTDEQIAAYERKQADIRASLMTAFPEQKSDKELVQQLRAYNARLMEELAAAQATIEQMREALEKVLDTRNAEARASSALANAEENFTDSSAESAAYAKAAVAASVAEREARDALLSVPTSLDALHEARAEALDRADRIFMQMSLELRDGTLRFAYGAARDVLKNEAAAHRARKEGK